VGGVTAAGFEIPSDLGPGSPLDSRHALRICRVRATRSAETSGLDAVGAPLTQTFNFGRLNTFIDTTEGIAPRIAAVGQREQLDLTGSRWEGDRPADWMRLRLDVAGGGLVDVRLIAIDWDSLTDTLALLEDLYYEELTGEPTNWDAQAVDNPGAAPDRVEPMHQVVLLPDDHDEPDWALWQRLIYRYDDDARQEFTSIAQPAELNRRPGQIAAVGTYGTVLWRLQSEVEQGIVISAALNVSALSSLQQTRPLAHTTLKDLHRNTAQNDEGYSTPARRRQQRHELVEIQETLSYLEAELTFGAEASATIAPLLPSLRIESYHQALYEAAGIQHQAAGVDRMLGRLRASVGDEAMVNHQPASRQYQAMTSTMAYGGLRPSEVVMLRPRVLTLPEAGWGRIEVAESDIDFDEPGDPKTGNRTVPIPGDLVGVLRRWLAVVGPVSDDALIFRTRYESRPSQSNWGRAWHLALKKIDHERLRVHDCRHFAATTWLHAGVPLGEAARRLGHSVETLVATYVSALKGDELIANQLIDNYLSSHTARTESGAPPEAD
jgi:integrase